MPAISVLAISLDMMLERGVSIEHLCRKLIATSFSKFTSVIAFHFYMQ
jgi:hypothetical protein